MYSVEITTKDGSGWVVAASETTAKDVVETLSALATVQMLGAEGSAPLFLRVGVDPDRALFAAMSDIASVKVAPAEENTE